MAWPLQLGEVIGISKPRSPDGTDGFRCGSLLAGGGPGRVTVTAGAVMVTVSAVAPLVVGIVAAVVVDVARRLDEVPPRRAPKNATSPTATRSAMAPAPSIFRRLAAWVGVVT